MLAAVRALGEICLKKNPGNEVTRQLDDPGAGGRVTMVAAVTFVEMGSDLVYSGVQLEDYEQEKNARYLYKKGSANGPDFSPTAKLTEPNKTVPNKLLNWFKVLEDKELEVEEEERDFLQKLHQCVKDEEKEILKAVQDLRDKIPKKDRILLTLKIQRADGLIRYPGDWPVFRNLLVQQARAKEFRQVAEDQVCSVCRKRKTRVLGNASVFKFYTEDKIGFVAGGFDKNRSWRNFPLCVTCREALMEGRRYIETKLAFAFCGMPYYLIPRSVMDSQDVLEDVIGILENADKKASLTEDAARKLTGDEKDILGYIKESKDIMTLNFLFMRKSNAAERINLLVEDVFPSRLRRIFAAKEAVEKIMTGPGPFTFRTLRNFFAKSDANKRDYDLDKYFLELVHRVFKDRPVQFTFVLRFMMQKIRQEFVNQNYFYPAVEDALKALLFLQNLELIKMEVKAPVEKREFDGYFEKFGSTFAQPLKKGIFLLGVLTEMLRRKQYSQRESTPFDKNLKSLKMTEREFKGLLPKVQNKLEEYQSFDKGKRRLAAAAAAYLLEAGDGWKLPVDELNFYFAVGMNLNKEVAELVYGTSEMETDEPKEGTI